MESIHTMFPPKDSGKEENGRHFVLVHGLCHGAWCWYKLSDMLLKAGHRVTAIDLDGSGINAVPADDIHSLSAYNQPLAHFLTSFYPDPHKVILVGHSLGGYNLTYTMERFPEKIGAAVFLAAFMPPSGTLVSIAQVLEEYRRQHGSLEDTEISYGRGPHNPPTSFKLGIRFCTKYLYQNSPSQVLINTMSDICLRQVVVHIKAECTKAIMQDITLAGSSLRSSPYWEERISYTKERYGMIPRVYIVTQEDKTIPEKSQREMIAENPPDGVYEIEGSDHSAFFSKPRRLADILKEISDIY